jgi:hypothetical protein
MSKPEPATHIEASEPDKVSAELGSGDAVADHSHPGTDAEAAAAPASAGSVNETSASTDGGDAAVEAALDEALVEAFGAEDQDAFFRWLLARVREVLALAPDSVGLREIARSLQRLAREGASEREAFEELCESFSEHGIEEALPVLATLAARALVEQQSRGAQPVGTSLARQLVAAATRAARRLVDAEGAPAVELLFALASRVGRQARARGISVRALPRLIERAALQRIARTKSAGSRPSEVGTGSSSMNDGQRQPRNDRAQPNMGRPAPGNQEQAPDSNGRERAVMSRLTLTGPIEIVIYQR